MKKNSFIIITMVILILLGCLWYYSKPFINCPKGYNRIVDNHLGKYVSCEDQNGRTSGISYEKSVHGYVQLFTFYNDVVIKSEYYTSTNGYLFQECHRENGLRKCTDYNKGKFNFLMGIKNFLKGFGGRYNTGLILTIANKNEDYIYQGPYYTYYENGILSLSGSYDKGLKTGLRIKYDENGNISSEEHY